MVALGCEESQHGSAWLQEGAMRQCSSMRSHDMASFSYEEQQHGNCFSMKSPNMTVLGYEDAQHDSAPIR